MESKCRQTSRKSSDVCSRFLFSCCDDWTSAESDEPEKREEAEDVVLRKDDGLLPSPLVVVLNSGLPLPPPPPLDIAVDSGEVDVGELGWVMMKSEE